MPELNLRVLHSRALEAILKDGAESDSARLAEGLFQRAVDITYQRMCTIDKQLETIQDKLTKLDLLLCKNPVTPSQLREIGLM